MKKTIAFALTAFLAAGTASSQAKELRFAHWLPPQHPFHQGVVEWAAALKEASNGALDVSIFPAAQLGAPNDHYDMAKSGTVDFAWITIGYAPGQFPIAELADIPFAVQGDPHKVSRAFDQWYRPYAETEMPDVKLCLAHFGPSGTFHTKKEVRLPPDISGLKVRPANAAVSSYIAAMGGSAVQVPATEARTAIERGVADALTFPMNSLVMFGIAKVVSHHLDAQLYFPGAAVLMNKATYEGLTGDERAAVDKLCSTEWADKFVAPWINWEQEGRAALEKAGGHQIYKPTEEELSAWRQVAEPLRVKWAETVKAKGHDPVAIEKALADALDAQGAK